MMKVWPVKHSPLLRQPERFIAPEPVSLMDYLPKDLTTLNDAYLPHGMAQAIVNWRNRDARRQQRKSWE